MSKVVYAVGTGQDASGALANLVFGPAMGDGLGKAGKYMDVKFGRGNTDVDVPNGSGRKPVTPDTDLAGSGPKTPKVDTDNLGVGSKSRPDIKGQKALDMDAWSKRSATGIQNLAQHESFTVEQVGNFKNQAIDVERNITIRTVVDGEVQNVRVKAIGFDEAGNIRIQEYTTAKDGLNISRQKALEAISKNGGVIVGDGKGKFSGGVEIPKGTQIDVVSQKTGNFHIEQVPQEVKQAAYDKVDEIAKSEVNWNPLERQQAFKDSMDIYAERAVIEGAVPSKADFYRMYAEREYSYPETYKTAIKENYLKSGASSIVNGESVKKFAFASDTSSIGRKDIVTGDGQGNFATSVIEDSILLYENGHLKSGSEIAVVKGLSDDAYASGIFQYEYSPELVQNMDKQDLLRFVSGNTPGSNSLNIPGAKTWA